MARNLINAVTPTIDGTPYTFTAVSAVAGDGDAVVPGTVLLINNASASPVTITLVTGGTSDQSLAIADYTFTIPAGTSEAVGPIPGGPTWIQQGGLSDGRVHVDYSASTSITRAALIVR
jgi:hypothetical protein